MAVHSMAVASFLRPRFCACKHSPLLSPYSSIRNFSEMSGSSSSVPVTLKDSDSNTATVIKYHDQTKHSFRRYARGPHGLDWANQPNPFRRYVSAPTADLLHLPPENSNDLLYSQIFQNFPIPRPVDSLSISQLFYDSLSLSAWKSTGISTWSLRVNPSSGNLHPTEGYIICGPVSGISDVPFLAHYAPKEHRLELRAIVPWEVWSELSSGFPENAFFIGLSSIFWREAWKYGERAFRYCNHDVGHAIGAISLAAAVMGWDARLVDQLGFEHIEALLGLAEENRQGFTVPDRPVRGYVPQLEREHGECLLVVFPAGSQQELRISPKVLSSVASRFLGLEFLGRPNALSMEHVCWDIIYRTAEAAKKPLSEQELVTRVAPLQNVIMVSEKSYKPLGIREVIRKRRSAVDMDDRVSIDSATFYQILSKVLPSGLGEEQGEQKQIPYRALTWKPNVHLVLFVHRVTGLKPGIYVLVRNKDHFNALKRSMNPGFEWSKPQGCPSGLPLYGLALGDCQNLATQLSCQQDIAGNGCFSLGMLAQFNPALSSGHAWMYPRLFWEAGLLGQVLYLEAHAAGISATGIGCYFDDPVHEVLGLAGKEFQSMYHFTIGAAVLDRRIMNLPAYPGPEIDS